MSPGGLAPPVGQPDHVQGAEDAAITLVEYGDYECPHCGRAYPIIKLVQRRLAADLRFVFRNFPLGDAHPHAQHAAEAAESVAAHAGDQAFWAMHDLIYQHQQDGPDALDDASLVALARRAGADAHAVADDLRFGRYAARVREDFMSGVRSGVNGTPTFFINGIRHDGPWDEESLVAALQAAAER